MTGRHDDLGDALRSRLLAETNAMPVNTHSAAESLRRRIAHTRKRRRLAVAVAASVAAAVVVVAGGGWLDAQRATDPAQNPTQNPAQVQAEAVAREFLAALDRSDADTAITYLTNNAIEFDFDSLEQLRLEFANNRALGRKQTIRDCSKDGNLASRVSVTCTFDLHIFRSDEIGIGPYTNNLWSLIVRDGKIDSVEQTTAQETNGFAEQMLEPFEAWVSQEHPEDVSTMYPDEYVTGRRFTKDGNRLWEQRIAEYATVVKQDPAAYIDQPKVAAYVAQLESTCAAAQARVRDEIQAIPQPNQPAVVEAQERIMRETIAELRRIPQPEAVRWPYVGRAFPLMDKFYEYGKFGGVGQPPASLARRIQQTPGLDKCIFPV
jgi:hypothetical protein